MAKEFIEKLKAWKKAYDVFPSMAADKEFQVLLDSGLIALEAERVGEVVVFESITVEADGCLNLSDTEYLPTGCAGKKGSLIFREDK